MVIIMHESSMPDVLERVSTRVIVGGLLSWRFHTVHTVLLPGRGGASRGLVCMATGY